MIIRNNLKIKDLQQQFSSRFPDLKLEFYSVPHKTEELTPNRYKLAPDTEISELTFLEKPVDLSLNGHTKIETLEQRFEALGLHVQVYRKSGNIWLQTSGTDHKTLSQLETSSSAFNTFLNNQK